MLWVVREVGLKCVFSWCLKVANVLDSLIVAGNSLQMVGTEKLKERPLKLVLRKEYVKESDWLSEDSMMFGVYVEGFWGSTYVL